MNKKHPVKHLFWLLGCLIATSFSWSVSLAQSRFITDPVQLNIGAESGETEIKIDFDGSAHDWQASVNVDWLQLDPAEGSGATWIVASFDQNTGLRRHAEITFTSLDGTMAPLVLEVRQFMGLGQDAMHFNFSVVHTPWTDPQVFPLRGHAGFSYLPGEAASYLNVLARFPETEESSWIVRNYYMPDRSWMLSEQSSGTYFDASAMGYSMFFRYDSIDYQWVLSSRPDSIVPVFPISDLTREAIELLEDDPEALPDVFLDADSAQLAELLALYEKTSLPESVTDLVYIGCLMPNLDLDKEKDSLDENGCAPAAAANSLMWLDLTSDHINSGLEVRKAYEELRSLMRVQGKQAISQGDFIKGKLDFIEAYDLPVKVKFQSHLHRDTIQSSSGLTKAYPKNRNPVEFPDRDFLVSELKEGEDVEIFTIPITSTGDPVRGKPGHVVVLSGTVTINGKTFIWYKHDLLQNQEDGLQHDKAVMRKAGNFWFMPELQEAIVLAVSESFDPEFIPAFPEEYFSRYCKSFRRTIAPGGSLKLTFPKNDQRCFNTTVRLLDRERSEFLSTEAWWNFNSGKTRTWHNDRDYPVTIEIHNDDAYSPRLPRKNGSGYTVEATKLINDPGAVSDPSNPDVFGGFSIGSDDNRHDEFNTLVASKVSFMNVLGAGYERFPSRIGASGVDTLEIIHPVPVWNRFWTELQLMVCIDSVATPGWLHIHSPSTGYRNSVQVDSSGTYTFFIGGIGEAQDFIMTLTTTDGASLFIDHVGVPSVLQVATEMALVPDSMLLAAAETTDTLFAIKNLGAEAMPWFLTYTSNWFAASPFAGIDDATIRLFVVPNAGAERSDRIRVVANNAVNSPQYLVITQQASGTGLDDRSTGVGLIRLYPNPAGEILTMVIGGMTGGEASWRIGTITGRVIEERRINIQPGVNSIQIDVGSFEPGIYLIEILANGLVYKDKVLITHQ